MLEELGGMCSLLSFRGVGHDLRGVAAAFRAPALQAGGPLWAPTRRTFDAQSKTGPPKEPVLEMELDGIVYPAAQVGTVMSDGGYLSDLLLAVGVGQLVR